MSGSQQNVHIERYKRTACYDWLVQRLFAFWHFKQPGGSMKKSKFSETQIVSIFKQPILASR